MLYKMSSRTSTVPVPVWLLPCPCNLQTLLEICVLCCPVQFSINFGRIAVNLSIVPWAAAQVFDLYVHPSCLLTSLHKFLHWPTCYLRYPKRSIRISAKFWTIQMHFCNVNMILFLFFFFGTLEAREGDIAYGKTRPSGLPNGLL